MNFSEALQELKCGGLVARAGWSGKDMFLFLVPGSTFQVSRPPLLGIYREGAVINYHAHIDMRTAGGQIVPWLASQTDILADDWGVYWGDVQPPADTELSAVELPTSPTVQPFSDVTHAVYVQGEAVYRGTQNECQCFADNHHPAGGYGIGPIQD